MERPYSTTAGASQASTSGNTGTSTGQRRGLENSSGAATAVPPPSRGQMSNFERAFQGVTSTTTSTSTTLSSRFFNPQGSSGNAATPPPLQASQSQSQSHAHATHHPGRGGGPSHSQLQPAAGPSGQGQGSRPSPALPSTVNCILVSRRQEGNPVLRLIRVVRWQFADIVPDYMVGENACALYLSLRYHLLHPEYLHFRIRELGGGGSAASSAFRLRLVICHVDVEDVVKPLAEVTKTAAVNDCTLICAWSNEEVARYLEVLKSYENKPADLIQERLEHDYLSRLTGALTTVRGINRTDAHTLGSNFDTFAGILSAPMEQLASCPGLGPTKVKRLFEAFHEPFKKPKRMLSSSAKEATPLISGTESLNAPSSANDQGNDEVEVMETTITQDKIEV